MSEILIIEILNVCDLDIGNDINRNKECEKSSFWDVNELNFRYFEFVLVDMWLRI